VSQHIEDDDLLNGLERLLIAARTIEHRDRRLILGLESDLRILLSKVQGRRDELARNLNAAGARSEAVNAYSRMARRGA
jgi:hypothetical protein